ncbi:pH-response regulator protein palH/rim-21 [Coniochaeta sp. 2T2.1]|nr:pH-response regulator protein palH/rim-21 [Coniochaeta sp. 2T2.1]
MEARQILGNKGADPSPTPLLTGQATRCSNFALASGGVLTINGEAITLSASAIYRPLCTQIPQPAIIANGGGSLTVNQTADDENTITDLPGARDPFYASTFPQTYALAATTVIAYTLVIMLFITPRSFLDGGVVVLGRKGFTSGGTGGTNIGGRPWLQKVAALTVAISLTIATSNTFRVAEEQYSRGFQNADWIQQEVLGGTELKVIRIISDTFLWLAQAQTLIRLFPRQREKIIIKWTAFALVTLDLIFQCLNSFIYTSQGNVRPRSFTDAVPALSYLFQLSLGVLYAAWVIYYSLMKKRYAFYHPRMRNMCLVAVLSIMAILVPVVFFILDICKPEVTGWGDYVRWVGAAAASVIVWEWVERIEALEREEKKDGILGREVFDGDEMLDVMPGDYTWPRRRKTGKSTSSRNDDGETGSGSRSQGTTSGTGNGGWTVSALATRYRSKSRQRGGPNRRAEQDRTQSTNHDRIRFLQPPLWPSRPPAAVTPVSRTDTASAASTVYAVRYRPLTETTSRTPEPNQTLPSRSSSPARTQRSDEDSSAPPPTEQQQPAAEAGQDRSGTRWRALAKGIPFPRIGRSPPPANAAERRQMQIDQQESNRWDIRGRLEEFAVSQAEKLREKISPSVNTDSLPVTVVPAPPRRGAALAQLLEEQELETLPQDQQPRSPTVEHGPSPGVQRQSSGGWASVASPTVGELQPQRRSSAASRPRPGPSAQPTSPTAPTTEPGRGRNRQLSITIVPAPSRQASSAQAPLTSPPLSPPRPVLGRRVSDLGRQVPDEETRDQ